MRAFEEIKNIKIFIVYRNIGEKYCDIISRPFCPSAQPLYVDSSFATQCCIYKQAFIKKKTAAPADLNITQKKVGL